MRAIADTDPSGESRRMREAGEDSPGGFMRRKLERVNLD
jgi:hypothetical protein